MRTKCANILVTCVSTILSLCVLEIGARIYVWAKANLQSREDQKVFELIGGREVSGTTFNIYYFGESTMVGDSYEPELSIPILVDYMLGHQVAGKRIRSINVAEAGENLDYNVGMLRRILEKRNIFKPSLCVIYCGHNEFFLGFDRTHRDTWFVAWCKRHSVVARRVLSAFNNYRLEIDERKYFDEPLFEQWEYDEVVREYCKKLGEAVHLLASSRIPVIVSTVVANYADWEPNRSVFRGNEADKEQFSRLMEDGKKAEAGGDVRCAVESYRGAVLLCPSFAEAHYRLGKCYETLHQDDRAWEEYQKAVECDRMPMRALPAQNNFIRKLGESGVAHMIDAVAYFREHTPNGNIGSNLMIDAHHPNLQGFILLSELIAKEIKDIFSPPSQEFHYVNEEQAKKIFKLDASKLFHYYCDKGQWLLRISTWIYNPDNRLRLCEELYRKAMALDASHCESYLGLAMINFMRKNTAEAAAYLDEARKRDPTRVKDFLNIPFIHDIVQRATGNTGV